MDTSKIKSLIFLDVHGVLTNTSSEFAFGKEWLDPVSARLMKMLLKKTGASVVITSNIRCGRSFDETVCALREMGGKGIAKRVIGITEEDESKMRGELIDKFIQDNSLSEVPYMIMDDSQSSFKLSEDVFITSRESGFKIGEYWHALRFLMK
jgi:hypothetical protein